jgi:hypothetical protein
MDVAAALQAAVRDLAGGQHRRTRSLGTSINDVLSTSDATLPILQNVGRILDALLTHREACPRDAQLLTTCAQRLSDAFDKRVHDASGTFYETLIQCAGTAEGLRVVPSNKSPRPSSAVFVVEPSSRGAWLVPGGTWHLQRVVEELLSDQASAAAIVLGCGTVGGVPKAYPPRMWGYPAGARPDISKSQFDVRQPRARRVSDEEMPVAPDPRAEAAEALLLLQPNGWQ